LYDEVLPSSCRPAQANSLAEGMLNTRQHRVYISTNLEIPDPDYLPSIAFKRRIHLLIAQHVPRDLLVPVGAGPPRLMPGGVAVPKGPVDEDS
jgi:hypothetical protein